MLCLLFPRGGVAGERSIEEGGREGQSRPKYMGLTRLKSGWRGSERASGLNSGPEVARHFQAS